LPALTFIATAHAVMQAGLRPVFADCDPATWQISPDAIADRLTKRTLAVLPVHLFGRPAQMPAILHLTRPLRIPVIEDAAQAHGACLNGRPVGGFGIAGAYSFYVAHTISAGEGGAVVTSNSSLGAIMRSLRAHGRACDCKECVLHTGRGRCRRRFISVRDDRRFRFIRVGFSGKMNELEAILGLDQLRHLENIVQQRRHNWLCLKQQLPAATEWFQMLEENPGEYVSPLCFPILLRPKTSFSRETITMFLESHGIETRPMFHSIPTQQPAYRFLGQRSGTYPHAEYVGRRGFYIGIHQSLGDCDIDRVVAVFKKFFRKSPR